MCATCVAQGVVYVGGAVAGLQVMAARARRRGASGSTREDAHVVDDADPLSTVTPVSSLDPALAVAGRPAAPVDD